MNPYLASCATVAAFLGASQAAPSPRVMTHVGRGDLPRLFLKLGMIRGAEVGVWTGGYSERLCLAMPNLQLLCVDPWRPYAAYREAKNDAGSTERAFTEAQARLAPFAVTFLRATSLTAAATQPDRALDFVYIDANHERDFVAEDLRAWTPKIRSGGILAGHDYRPAPEGKPFLQVKDAVDAYVAAERIHPWYVLASERTPSFLWVVA